MHEGDGEEERMKGEVTGSLQKEIIRRVAWPSVSIFHL
jgi:hypothetical protein